MEMKTARVVAGDIFSSFDVTASAKQNNLCI